MTMTEEQIEALPWEPADSTNVKRICWKASGKDTDEDERLGVLYVEFVQGARYGYHDVTEGDYDRVTSAESIGTALNTLIKPEYDFDRLEDG